VRVLRADGVVEVTEEQAQQLLNRLAGIHASLRCIIGLLSFYGSYFFIAHILRK
jgi:uncharacterized membrane protein (Fun14 family)